MPAATQPPEPEGWVSARDTAELLGVRIQAVGWRVEHGHLEGRKHQGMWWVTQASLDAEVADRAEWVSWAEAAELTGARPSTVGTAVKRGLISNRPGPNTLRSLHRESVLAWAAQRKADQAERAAIRAAREARSGPPDDGHVWLGTTDTALVSASPAAASTSSSTPVASRRPGSAAGGGSAATTSSRSPPHVRSERLPTRRFPRTASEHHSAERQTRVIVPFAAQKWVRGHPSEVAATSA